MDGEVREALFQMVKDITTEAQDITAQDTREIVPQEKQDDCTMASHLRDFTRISHVLWIRS